MATDTQEAPPVVETIDYEALSKQFSLGGENEAPPSEVPVLSDAPPPEGSPPPVETPAEPVEKKLTNAEQAKRRIDAKELARERDEIKAKLEAAERERDEFRRRFEETEPKVSEYKTLAEQKAAKAEELEKAFRNEKAVVPSDVLAQVPEVQEAEKSFMGAAKSLFPRDLSNPDDNQPDLRFDQSLLANPDTAAQVNKFINHWESIEYGDKGTPQGRSDAQHVTLSLLAKTIGVPESSFVTKVIDGAEYLALPPSHPVYKHLKNSIGQFVEARQKLNEVKRSAADNVKQTISSVAGKRIENTRTFLREAGVGLTGEDLKTALARQPQNPILQAMEVLQEHEDLVSELRQEQDLEVALNGVFRPQFDIAEDDPVEHTRLANAHLQRVGRRVIHAPLAGPLMKLTVRQKQLIAEQAKRIAELTAEVEASARQGEPGFVGSGANDTGSDEDYGQYTQVAKNLGLLSK